MRELRTAIEVAATPDRIWQVLTDFASFPSWNPFVREVSGTLAVGSRLRVRLGAPGQRPMRFRPRVLVVQPGRELRWKGRLGVPGIFDGEHIFEIEARPGGARLVQREIFSGLLVPLLKKMIEGPTRAGFEAMNEALKARAEAAG